VLDVDLYPSLPSWLMISVSSRKATDGPSGLPLTTCVRCHVGYAQQLRRQKLNLELPVCVEGVLVDHVFSDIRLFDMSICSGDICDESRKLSEIAPKFGRFLALPNLWGGHSKSCTRVITPASRHGWKSFVRILIPAPKLLRLTR